MYHAELMSPEHEALRLSILQDAMSIIRLTKYYLRNGEITLQMSIFLS